MAADHDAWAPLARRVLDTVAAHTSVPVAGILAPTRTEEAVAARQLCFALSRALGMPWSSICFWWSRDNSTVRHGAHRALERTAPEEIARLVERLRAAPLQMEARDTLELLVRIEALERQLNRLTAALAAAGGA